MTETEDQVTITLIGGPPDWAGKMLTYPRSVLEHHDQAGAYLISAHTPERGEDEDPDPRAVYLPDEEPADPRVWRFRGWLPASPSDPPVD